eukprot:4411725-Prymnesium_polylepis.1
MLYFQLAAGAARVVLRGRCGRLDARSDLLCVHHAVRLLVVLHRVRYRLERRQRDRLPISALELWPCRCLLRHRTASLGHLLPRPQLRPIIGPRRAALRAAVHVLLRRDRDRARALGGVQRALSGHVRAHRHLGR